MGQPAAAAGDRVTATDTHIVVPASGTPTAVPLPFGGALNGGLSANVRVSGRPAATVGSSVTNTPPHIAPQPLAKPPANRGTIIGGSATVRINGRPAARNGDPVLTCNDPVDLPVGRITATGAVRIG